MALEGLGMYIRSLNQQAQEPFDLSFNAQDMPTVGDVLTMPIKASLGYNLVRSAWWGSKAVGMNPSSRLTNPFNPAHLQWRYKAKATTGITSRLIDHVGSTVGKGLNWASVGKYGVKEGAEAGVPWYKRYIYSRKKDASILGQIGERKGAPELVKTMGLGTLDRYLLRPQEMHDRMASMHAGFRTAITAEELGESMLTNLYEASNLRGTKGATLLTRGRYAPNIPTEYDQLKSAFSKAGPVADEFGQYSLFERTAAGTPEYLKGKSYVLEDLVGGFNDPSRMLKESYYSGWREGGRKKFLNMSRGHKVSVFDIISGRGEGFKKGAEEGFFKSRARYIKDQVGFGYDDGTRKRLSLYHTRGASARKFHQQYMLAYDKTYQQAAIKTAKQHATTVADQFTKYTEYMTDYKEGGRNLIKKEALAARSRITRLRLLKGAATTMVGVSAAAWLTKTIVSGALTLPGKMAATARELMRPEFGSGEVISNSRVASERQRAVQAIQSAHMNARYLLGNEAPMYH